MIRAFARTRVLKGPGRADVDLAMTKWWGKKRPAEGQVSEVLFHFCFSRVLKPVREMTSAFRRFASINPFKRCSKEHITSSDQCTAADSVVLLWLFASRHCIYESHVNAPVLNAGEHILVRSMYLIYDECGREERKLALKY
jgi:hypothetical protein